MVLPLLAGKIRVFELVVRDQKVDHSEELRFACVVGMRLEMLARMWEEVQLDDQETFLLKDQSLYWFP